jgi:predicted ATPase
VGKRESAKSRLVEALRTHVAGDAGHYLQHEPRPVALESRCSPFHQNSALYPLAELLSQALDIRQDRPSVR